MNTNISSTIHNCVSMTTNEIATITGKEHDKVCRDFVVQCKHLSIPPASFRESYQAENGQTYNCYRLPRHECFLLVSGYSVVLRDKILKRWTELELEQSGPALTMEEITLQNCQALINQNKQRQADLAHQAEINEAQSEQIKQLEDRSITTATSLPAGYATIQTIRTKNDIPLSESNIKKIIHNYGIDTQTFTTGNDLFVNHNCLGYHVQSLLEACEEVIDQAQSIGNGTRQWAPGLPDGFYILG